MGISSSMEERQSEFMAVEMKSAGGGKPEILVYRKLRNEDEDEDRIHTVVTSADLKVNTKSSKKQKAVHPDDPCTSSSTKASKDSKGKYSRLLDDDDIQEESFCVDLENRAFVASKRSFSAFLRGEGEETSLCAEDEFQKLHYVDPAVRIRVRREFWASVIASLFFGIMAIAVSVYGFILMINRDDPQNHLKKVAVNLCKTLRSTPIEMVDVKQLYYFMELREKYLPTDIIYSYFEPTLNSHTFVYNLEVNETHHYSDDELIILTVCSVAEALLNTTYCC